jgi:chromosome segregation ATPase
MTAMARKREPVEGGQMPVNERDEQGVQIAELRSDVRHIQSDLTDIKAELRATNQRFEKFDQKFDDLKDSLASAKMWALGLYIALTGSLLFVMAHGFKWL